MQEYGCPNSARSQGFSPSEASQAKAGLSLQHAALEKEGCISVFSEKMSGTTTNGREQLRMLLNIVQEGDIVVVTRIDRLARSMKDLQDIVHESRAKGVSFKATEQPIDTSTAVGKAFLDMLGVFAEFEANLRKERQLEGRRQRPKAFMQRTAVAKPHLNGAFVRISHPRRQGGGLSGAPVAEARVGLLLV